MNQSKNTGNEELDKKLREIIWYELGDGLNATDVEECIGSIKRIYADEVTPKVDSLVQDMVNLHANMKQHMYRLGLTSTPVASSVVQPPNPDNTELDNILIELLQNLDYYGEYDYDLKSIYKPYIINRRSDVAEDYDNAKHQINALITKAKIAELRQAMLVIEQNGASPELTNIQVINAKRITELTNQIKELTTKENK